MASTFFRTSRDDISFFLPLPRSMQSPSVTVTDAQRQQFAAQGFIIFPNVLPKDLMHKALRVVNTAIGKMEGIKAEDVEKFKNGVLFPELASCEEFMNVYFGSPIKKIVEEYCGPTQGVLGAQIALRFPGTLCLDKKEFVPSPFWSHAWHIDGLDFSPNSMSMMGAQKRSPGCFTALIGVTLSDTSDEMHGQLVVYPGGHLLMENWCKQPGNLEKLAANGESALPPLFLPPAKQICAPAGSLVLCHYMLPHSIAPNSSAFTRYALYFRAFSQLHSLSEPYKPSSMQNIWQDWPPLKQHLSHLPKIQADLVALDAKHGPALAAADKAFDSGNPSAALPLYEQLLPLRPDVVVWRFKAAFCALQVAVPLFMAGKKADAKRFASTGESYIRQALSIAPRFVVLLPLLARLLQIQERPEDAYRCIEQVLLGPTLETEDSWQKDLIKDGLKCGLELHAALKKPSAASAALTARFEAKFPFLDTSATAADVTVAQLQAEGDRIMKKEPKTEEVWQEGQKVFARLCQLQPSVWWWQLQAAACYSFGPAATADLAEPHARTAIQLQERSPTEIPSLAAFALLGRTLGQQNKHEEAIAVLKRIPVKHAALKSQGIKLNEPGTPGGEIEELFILESFRVLKASCGALKKQEELSQGHQQFTREYPQLTAKFADILRESNCVIS